MEEYQKPHCNTCPYLPWMIDFHSTECGKVANQQLNAVFANTYIEFMSNLHPRSKPGKINLTQIICLITPTLIYEEILELLERGMRIALLNLDWFDHDQMKEMIKILREACREYSQKEGYQYILSIGLDITTPQLKIGKFLKTGKFLKPVSEVEICKGDEVSITSNPHYEKRMTKNKLYVNEEIASFLKPGDSLIIGEARLSAINICKEIVECIVEKAGKIIDNMNVNLANIPQLSQSEEIIDGYYNIVMEFHLDLVLVPPQRLEFSKKLLRSSILVFSKLESEKCVDEIDEIIHRSDGVFIDNDRLLSLFHQNLFIFQKMVCGKCNSVGKPVFILINCNEMTRSHVFDVANSVIDGVDGIIVPPDIAVIATVQSICKSAEMAVYQKNICQYLKNNIIPPIEPILATALEAARLTLNTNAAAIIVLTTTGRCARFLSQLRPRCPILALSRYPKTARMLKCYKGILPLLLTSGTDIIDYNDDVMSRLQSAVTWGKLKGIIRMGDAIVLITGSRPAVGFTNNIRVVFASDYFVQMQKVRVTN